MHIVHHTCYMVVSLCRRAHFFFGSAFFFLLLCYFYVAFNVCISFYESATPNERVSRVCACLRRCVCVRVSFYLFGRRIRLLLWLVRGDVRPKTLPLPRHRRNENDAAAATTTKNRNRAAHGSRAVQIAPKRKRWQLQFRS